MLTLIFVNNDKPREILSQREYYNQNLENFIIPDIGDGIILPLKEMIQDQNDIKPFKYRIIDRIIRFFFSSNGQTIILVCKPDDSISIL